MDHAPQAAVLMDMEMLQALKGDPAAADGVPEQTGGQAAALDGQGGRVGERPVLLLAVELHTSKAGRAGGEEIGVRHRQAAVGGKGRRAVQARRRGPAAGQVGGSPSEGNGKGQGKHQGGGGAEDHRPAP